VVHRPSLVRAHFIFCLLIIDDVSPRLVLETDVCVAFMVNSSPSVLVWFVDIGRHCIRQYLVARPSGDSWQVNPSGTTRSLRHLTIVRLCTADRRRRDPTCPSLTRYTLSTSRFRLGLSSLSLGWDTWPRRFVLPL
ncbi:uncharacterized protein B0H18DRAFT_977116, partial [Fomitopsis serialis]|uniref:uncharacterized protein n=1 Tax=Fomitopsis serialis TaxID=139415 RepID=UPI0020088A6B